MWTGIDYLGEAVGPVKVRVQVLLIFAVSQKTVIIFIRVSGQKNL